MMKTRPFIFLFLCFLFFLFQEGCKNNSASKEKSLRKSTDGFSVEGYIVKPVLLNQKITVSGTLRPFEETVLMPDVSGRITSIHLPEGKFVRQGTLLVKLFDDDLQASLKKLKTQLSIAEQTEIRQRELIQVNGISQQEYDQSALQVSSIKNDIEIVNAQIRKTEVLAPFDGVIGLRYVSVGTQVTPTVSLATIRTTDKLKLDFSVPEKYSRYINEGSLVKFTIQGDDDVHSGKVIATEESIETSTRNLNVRAVVEGSSPVLKPGAYASVELDLGIISDAMMVPTQSIIPQERNKKIIVVRNGIADFTSVTTGIREASKIQVLQGLKMGDTIAITGIQFLKPEGKVRFSKIIQD